MALVVDVTETCEECEASYTAMYERLYRWPVVNAGSGEIVIMMPCWHLAELAVDRLNDYAEQLGNGPVFYIGPKRPS